MIKLTKKAAVFVLLSGALILSACGGGGEQTPTIDPDAIFTAAAITVQAQLTEIAALTPSATPTPLPTNTPQPSPTTNMSLPTFAPLVTSTQQAPAVPSAADKCEYVGQNFADGHTFFPNYDFDMHWTVKNTGTTTWTTAYQLRFYAGDRMHKSANYSFRNSVAPGDQYTAMADIEAPSKQGTYRGIWVLTNADGVNYCNFDMEIKVGDGPTPIP